MIYWFFIAPAGKCSNMNVKCCLFHFLLLQDLLHSRCVHLCSCHLRTITTEGATATPTHAVTTQPVMMKSCSSMPFTRVCSSPRVHSIHRSENFLLVHSVHFLMMSVSNMQSGWLFCFRTIGVIPMDRQHNP